MQATFGTKVDSLLEVKPISYELMTVPCTIDNSGEKRYSTHRTVYDIEVEGNHNYFVQGVLVSNCQQRLKPGIYHRIKESGEIEAHINVKSGTGLGGKILFHPDTAIFVLQAGTTQIKLYGLLKDLGVGDSEMEKAWGSEIFQKNKSGYDGKEIDKYYQKVFKYG